MAEMPPPETGSVPEDMKKKVRAILLSKIGGVPLQRFSSDFKKLEGKALHFRELGFKNLREFLEAMPDAVRFEYKDKAGLWMLYGVGDQKSFMSSAAKKAQYSRPSDGIKDKNKMTKGRKNPGNKNPRNNNNKETTRPSKKMNGTDREHESRPPSTAPHGEHPSNAKPMSHSGENAGTEGEVRVAKSQRGLYSVCVYLEEFKGHQRIPGYIQEITELFAAQGDVVESNHVKRLIFFRFAEESEAIAIINNFNGRILQDGNKMRVTAASEKKAADKEKVPETKPTETKPMEHPMIPMHGLPNGTLEHAVFHDNTVDICVFNIRGPVHPDFIMAYFWSFQPVDVQLHESKNSMYSFVKFSCIADACNAMSAMQGSLINGAPIRIELSKRKAKAQVQDGPKENKRKSRPPSRNGKYREGKSWNQRRRPKSEDDSCDSITPEITDGQNPVSPPHIHNQVPDIGDSSLSVRTHPQPKSDHESSRINNNTSMGRGRGAFSARSSPSFGRGLANLYPESVKKPPRPSIANLSLDDL